MSSRVPIVCLVAVFALIGLAPIVTALASAPQSGQTAVLFDPRLGDAGLVQHLSQTNATLVRFGALPGTAIVDVPPGSRSQLSQAGAWLMADPLILGGCMTSASNQTPLNGAV